MQRGAQYDWDEANRGHVAAHQVEPREVEEVLRNDPLFQHSRIDSASGEERIAELGHTDAGRVLFVVWTPRGEWTRPVTAWPANRRTRSLYERKRREKKETES